jgi:hypothetical protein
MGSTPFDPDGHNLPEKGPLGPRIPQEIAPVVRGFDRDW